MLEAIPTDLLSSNFRLHEERQLIGEVETSIWRERARLELEEGTYHLFRERAFGGDFLLERNGSVVARATKPSALRSKFEVEVGDRQLELRRLSLLNRRFGVFQDGKQVGSIYPLGIFTRRSNIDLPSDLPISTRVFLFWLVFLMWKREQSAAS